MGISKVSNAFMPIHQNEPEHGASSIGSEVAAVLGNSGALSADGRTITARQSRGPIRFDIDDPEGRRTCFGVSGLPNWAVERLILHYSDNERNVDGSDFNNASEWLEALLAAKKYVGLGLGYNGKRVDVTETTGPSVYVVSDQTGEKEYSNLDDIPDLDYFEPAMRKEAERRMKDLERNQRQAAVQHRLDEMLHASEALVSPRPPVGLKVATATLAVDHADRHREGRDTTAFVDQQSAELDHLSGPEDISTGHPSGDEQSVPALHTPLAERAQRVTDALSKAASVLQDLEEEVRARTAVAQRLATEEEAHRARTDQAAAIASATETQNKAITEFISGMLSERTAELNAQEKAIEERLARVQSEARERERKTRARDLLLAIPGSIIIGAAVILIMHFVFRV